MKLFRRKKKEPPPAYRVDAVLIYDKETIYRNCTVQVLENTVTGDVSIGWWQNAEDGQGTADL